MTTNSAPIQPNLDLPKWLWLGLPLVVLAALLAAGLTGRVDVMQSEFGLVENLTLVILLAAIILGIRLVFFRRTVPGRFLGVWALILTLGAVYFAGEEASWGYHLFGWELMEGLKGINDQHEPNLHNLSGIAGTLLDQLPRLMLTITAVVGGIVVPLWLRYVRPIAWPTDWIWPTIVCLPAAVLAVTVSLPGKILELFNINVGPQGENKELFLAMFIMMYLASLTYRFGRTKRADVSSQSWHTSPVGS